MKRLYYILLILPLLMTSCTGEVEDVFSEESSQRMQAALTKYRGILTAAPNGWIGDYYPEVNYKIGGYAMFFEFDKEGNVTISCERTNVNKGEPATSEWELIPEQGPVLSFLTHNPVLHYFSEPSQGDINGMQGDFEFVVMNATQDVVELMGKRAKNRLFLRNNKDNLDPAEYFAAVRAMEDTNDEYDAFKLNLNKKEIGKLTTVNRTFEAEITKESENGNGNGNGNGEEEEEKEDVVEKRIFSFCFTPVGLRFAYPYDIEGVEVQNFVLDIETGRYTCTDPGVDVVLQSYTPAQGEGK